LIILKIFTSQTIPNRGPIGWNPVIWFPPNWSPIFFYLLRFSIPIAAEKWRKRRTIKFQSRYLNRVQSGILYLVTNRTLLLVSDMLLSAYRLITFNTIFIDNTGRKTKNQQDYLAKKALPIFAYFCLFSIILAYSCLFSFILIYPQIFTN
jgi:hypothetical protein